MKYRFLILAFLSLLHFSGCVNVKELDDNATVASCTISAHSPEAVIFGEPVVEEGTIILPMDYGKYEFPVSVTLDIRTGQPIDKILGPDADNTLIFENEGTVRRIHLIALSGVVHTYEIRIEVAPRSEEASVLQASMTGYRPEGFLLSRELIVDVVENVIGIYALTGETLPLTVSLALELSPGARIETTKNEHTFVLDAYDTKVPLTLVAESGKKETWYLSLTGVTVLDDASQTDADTWERMTPLSPFGISFRQDALQTVHILPDQAESRFTVLVKDFATPFPWNARFLYGIQPYILQIGLTPEEEFSVSRWEDNKVFYLADVLSLQARAWNVCWEKWLNPANEVVSFGILEYTSARNEMVLGAAQVDTLRSGIRIPMTAGNDFPLEISEYELVVSEEAVTDLQGPVVFETYKSSVPFRVTSQSGNIREWTVELDPWFETGSDILNFSVEAFHSQENLVRLESPLAAIDQQNKTLTLVLKAGYDFPLVLEDFTFELSPGASLQEDVSGGITFMTIGDVVPLTVRAESGDITEWMLQLADERIENLEALVLDYRIESYLGTSQTANNISFLKQGITDTLNRTVTLVISDWSSKMPVTVNGVMNLSKNARLEGDISSLQHSLVFYTTEQQYRFSVTSESGTNVTHWTLKLEDRSPVRLSGTEVVDFVTGSPSSGFVFDQKTIEPDVSAITLLVSTRPSKEALLTIKPRITVSEGARLQGITSGAPLALSFSEPFVFRVMAANENVREWQIRLIYAPQVFNSGYEEWGTVDNVMNILPSNGSGWTTGNNVQVIGTTRVQGKDSPYAAQMLTQLKTVNLVVIKVTSLAAGAVMLGKFNFSMDVDAVMNPTSMSDFGIPFTTDTNPVGFEIDYQYQSGGQRVYTEAYRGALGMPAFRDPKKIDGPDKAVIATELHYNAGGAWSYDLKNRPTLIAESEIITEGTAGWTRARLVFSKVPGKENLQMTHLVVRMSSSYQGDEFKGADGSRLTVDNFRLIYYLPGPGARILE